MPEPFRSVLLNYLGTLERYRLLTYGQQIVRSVTELARPEIAAVIHRDLRHLVDEYQDVNTAQMLSSWSFSEPEVGLEPTTCCLQDSCSGQLSYSGIRALGRGRMTCRGVGL